MSTERSFDPKTTYISGGLNDSTGREPFEDPTRDFIPSGTAPAATAGHLHHEHGHNHNEGLENLSSSTFPTSGNTTENYNTGSNINTGSNTGPNTGLETGLTNEHSHSHHKHHHEAQAKYEATHGSIDHFKPDTSGNIKAGTAKDPAVGEGKHTGHGLAEVGYVGNQTGDSYGGVQTGDSHYGTGQNLSNTDRSVTDKIKDKISGNDGKIDAAPGTELHGSNIYGSNNAAREYENDTERRSGSGLTGSGDAAGYDRTTGGVGNQGVRDFQGSESGGPISGGAAGTDRFDTSKDHGVTKDTGLTDSLNTGNQYGHDVDNKSSNDHTASGLTRHGDDFTKGDTADSAYHNYQPTGLTGRETTTTGVQDKNLESTGAAHGGGLLDKVKNLIGGHSNTTNAK